jgi:hypothetical protein
MSVYEGGAYATTSTGGGGGGGAPAWGEIEGTLSNQSDLQVALDGKIDIDGLNSEISNLNFSPVTAPAYAEGRLWYDNNTKTLSLYDDHAGTSIQLGKESVIDARNDTGDTIANGQAVFISGAIGQHPTIALAIADSEETSLCIGLATHDIANNSTGKVTVLGSVGGLNTSAFTDGAALYLSASTAGVLTTTPPASPNLSVLVGYVTHSHVTQGQILVYPKQTISNNNALGTSQSIPPSENAVKEYVDSGLGTKEPTITAGTTAQYWRGDKSFQALNKAAVGLGNVDNTSDANKPISTATQNALNNKQDSDPDLTAIAGLTPANDDFIQRKAETWTNRTIPQVKADLGISDLSGYRLIKTTTLTTGTAATFTPDPRTTALLVDVYGATGGGGAANGQGAGTVAVGDAGGNGGFSSSFILIAPGEIYTYTIGAGGVGGAVPNGNGTSGGTTSFIGSVFGTTQVTGGAGGLGVIGSAAAGSVQGAPGVPSGGNILNLLGSRCISGRWVGGEIYIYPNNGSPLFGAGKILGNSGAGSAGALGAGGLGGFAFSTATDYPGGDGFRGEIHVSEYTGGV